MSSFFYKPRVDIRRKFKRTIVVLKSPFHYKTPKHHIQYSYFTINTSFAVKAEHLLRARTVLTSFFLQNKPNRYQQKMCMGLDLQGIILQWFHSYF